MQDKGLARFNRHGAGRELQRRGLPVAADPLEIGRDALDRGRDRNAGAGVAARSAQHETIMRGVDVAAGAELREHRARDAREEGSPLGAEPHESGRRRFDLHGRLLADESTGRGFDGHGGVLGKWVVQHDRAAAVTRARRERNGSDATAATHRRSAADVIGVGAGGPRRRECA